MEFISNWPRFLKPLYDPGRSDFPSPVLASVLHAISQGGPSPTARNCGAGAPFAPTRWSLPRPFATLQASRNPALCLVRTRLSWPPSAQSPFARSGCYPRRGDLKAAWRGVTPSSSLVRAHAPDHPPPHASARALCAGSLQVLASPCWAMALPDIISATLVQVLGPIPRRAPRLHSSISSPRTPASPHGKRVRRADLSPHGSFRGEPYFVAAVIRSPSGSCTRSASRLLRPRRLRAGPPGLSHHASPGRLPRPGCGVATCSTWTISPDRAVRPAPPGFGGAESSG